MSTSESKPTSERDAETRAHIPLRPGRTQARRSRLNQPEDVPTPEAITPSEAAPPPPKSEPAAPVRKMKFKRSGQMHDDLSDPEATPTDPKDTY